MHCLEAGQQLVAQGLGAALGSEVDITAVLVELLGLHAELSTVLPRKGTKQSACASA